MGGSRADKAASHERIVKAAAARIRRDGVEGVGVADLMPEAGLTHGGFYRHFGPRDDLVAEAVEAALAHGSRRAEAAAQLGGSEALAMASDAYLSPIHRDKLETGCAVAALPTDIARSSQRARGGIHRAGPSLPRPVRRIDTCRRSRRALSHPCRAGRCDRARSSRQRSEPLR